MRCLPILATLLLPSAVAQVPAGLPPIELSSTDGMDPAVVALVDECIAAARREPSNAAAHARLGMAYEANLMHPHARAAYENAARLAPDDPLLRYRLGVLRSVTGDPARALTALRRVVAARPDLLAAQARLAATAFELGELEESETHWRRAIELEGELHYASSRVGLAEVWIELDRAPQAIALLEQTLAMDPGYLHGHFVLGQALLACDRVRAAEGALRRGEDSSRGFPPGPQCDSIGALAVGRTGRMNRVGELLAAGRPRAAVAILEELGRQYPDDPLVRMKLARAHGAAGDLDDALALLLETTRSHPNHPELSLLLARAALARRARTTDAAERDMLADLAVAAADRACSLAPTHGPARYLRAVLRSDVLSPPQCGAALEDLLAARRFGCRERDLCERIARMYARAGNAREALRHAELSAQENADEPGALLFLAHARSAGNDLAGAREAFERARALAPQRADVLAFERRLGARLAKHGKDPR